MFRCEATTLKEVGDFVLFTTVSVIALQSTLTVTREDFSTCYIPNHSPEYKNGVPANLNFVELEDGDWAGAPYIKKGDYNQRPKGGSGIISKTTYITAPGTCNITRVVCTLNPNLNALGLAQNAAHELLGHAYLELLWQNDTNNPKTAVNSGHFYYINKDYNNEINNDPAISPLIERAMRVAEKRDRENKK